MTLRYKIALCNVFWSEDGIDTRYFSSISDQNSYFDTLTSGLFSPLVNFSMGNNIETTIVYTDKSLRDGSTLCKCNYAVILKTGIDENEQETILERRYFFAYPSQDSGSKMRVRLSLDDIQTNYFAHKSTIAPCFIKKAHLNRFVQDPNNTAKVFNDGGLASPLFERESIQEVAKRLTSRTKIKLKMSNNDNFNKWFYDNVLGWVYIYCDHRPYKLLRDTTGHEAEFTLNTPDMTPQYNSSSDLENILNVFCFPILKGTKHLYFWDDVFGSGYATAKTDCGTAGYSAFRGTNGGASYIKSVKFSILPPGFLGSLTEGDGTTDTDFYIDSNGNMNIKGSAITDYRGLSKFRCWQTTTDVPGNGDGLIQVQSNDSFTSEQIDISTFLSNHGRQHTKSYIKLNDGDSFSLYPKFNSQDYFELKLTNERGQGFIYDLQKLNTNYITCEYTEALTPDITRSYLRIKNTSGIYIAECSQNLTGLVDSADMSLMVDNDQLSQMLAQNKNFYLQNALQIGERAFVGGVAGAQKGGVAGAVAGSLGEVVIGAINTELSIDNMRNAPHQLLNANGNAYFNTQYTEPGLYLETYDILDFEKFILMGIWSKEGFVYNKIDSFSNVDNIRKRFNYIEANVEGITAPISNEEKNRLRQRLSKIRFWNDDNITNYLRNYERWLDNE